MNDKDILISQFIDDELTLAEKAAFVREVHEDGVFYEEAVSMLDIEKELSVPADTAVPEIHYKKPFNITAMASFTALAASLAVMIKVFLFAPTPATVEQVKLYQRFVVHAPEAHNVALTGSFSSWQKMSMKNNGNGYWEITVPLNKGEYTYSYIINGKDQMADPSVPAKVTDDFGGENSVINVGEDI